MLSERSSLAVVVRRELREPGLLYDSQVPHEGATGAQYLVVHNPANAWQC